MSTLRAVCACLAVWLALGECWWPFSSETADEETRVEASHGPSVNPGAPVAFEMKSAEQKFLAEANQFLELPPLERCQNKVANT